MDIKPIGIIRSPFQHSAGTPIQPAFAQGTEGTVEVFSKFAEALSDLEGFERIWLLCWLDRASQFHLKVKPYLDRQPRGLFATRAPSRPNPIGLSCVKLLSVENNRLHVADIDLLDGTPLLDIKPYVKKFDCFDVRRNGWLDAVAKENTQADDRFFQNHT